MDWSRQLSLWFFSIPIWIVAFLPSLLVGGFFLRRNFHEKDQAQKAENSLFTALLGGFVLWKVSPLLSSWDSLGTSPLGWLYLPGNRWGLLAGGLWFLGTLVFSLWRAGKFRLDFLRGLLWWAGSGAGTFLVLWSALAFFPLPASSPVPELNPKATSLPLTTLDDRTITLDSLRGKTVIVNFWATWCAPCQAEIPELEAFYRTANRDQVEIIGVNATSTEKADADVRRYLGARSVSYPVVWDRDGRLSQLFGAVSLPTTWVLSPNGKWKDRRTGAVSRDDLESFLR